MLRLMEEKDIPIVIKLHAGYIPGALFPKLGDPFMYALYRTMMKLDSAVNYVWEDEGKTVGFITATTHAGNLLRQVMFNNLPLFAWRTFLYILGNPLRIGEIWETLTYSKLADLPGVDGELLFIAIDRDFRKRNISDDLVNACLDWLKQKGHDKVKVTTYTTNRGANTLLERLGFSVARVLPFRGKEINMYLFHIDGKKEENKENGDKENK